MYCSHSVHIDYQLPTYIVLGYAKVGKTTFIRSQHATHAQLFITWEEKNQITEMAWIWTGDKACFIEISQAVLKRLDQLYNFFALLYRQRLSFACIFLIISATHLVIRDQNEFYPALIQAIAVLTYILQKPSAVVIILSQMNQFIGFQEFFAPLYNQQNQPWGINLDSYHAQEVILSVVRDKFQQWEQKLQEQFIESLYHTQTVKKRYLIQKFQMQGTYLLRTVLCYIQYLIKNEVFSAQLWLGGIYSVGLKNVVTDINDTPVIDIFAHTLASDISNLRSHQQHLLIIHRSQNTVYSGKTCLYFSKNIVETIAQDKYNQQKKQSRLSQTMIYQGVILWFLFIVGIASLTFSYYKHLHILSCVNKTVLENRNESLNSESSQSFTEKLASTIARLNTLQHTLALTRQFQWFSIRQKEIVHHISYIYRKELRNLGYCLIKSLSHHLHTLESPEDLYNFLKVFQILQGKHDQYQDFLIDQLIKVSEKAKIQVHLQSALRSYIADFILKEAEYLLKNTTLFTQKDLETVEKIRHSLKALPTKQKVWLALNSHFSQRKTTPLFSRKDTVKEKQLFSEKFRNKKILLQYTYENFNTIYTQLIPKLTKAVMQGRDFVLYDQTEVKEEVSQLNEAQMTQLVSAIRVAWLNDYTNFWLNLLQETAVVDIHSWHQMRTIFTYFSEHPFPFKELITTITQHTSWILLQQTLTQWNMQDQWLIQQHLTQHFESLAALELQPHLKLLSPLVTQVRLPLEKLSSYLHALFVTEKTHVVSFQLMKQYFLHPTENQLLSHFLQSSLSLPMPLQNWMYQFIVQVRQLLVQETEQYINTTWRENVVNFYTTYIEGRYPVFRNSQDDIQIEHFNRFFGPKGILQNYINDYLFPFLKTDTVRWSTQKYNDICLTIPAFVMTELERAQLIQQLFFKEKEKSYEKLMLKVLYLPPKVTLKIQCGEKIYFIRNKDTQIEINWPLTTDRSYKDLVFTIQKEGIVEYTKIFQGVWHWLRFTDQQYNMKSTIPLIFTLKKNEDTVVQCQVQPKHKANIFIHGIIEKFRCPSQLTV